MVKDVYHVKYDLNSSYINRIYFLNFILLFKFIIQVLFYYCNLQEKIYCKRKNNGAEDSYHCTIVFASWEL